MNMVTSEELGKKIREAREEAGLSQQELGSMLNPPRSHAAVSDMERGVTRVGATDIAQIARLLNRETSYFYGEQARPSPNALYARGDADRDDIADFKRRVEAILRERKEKE